MKLIFTMLSLFFAQLVMAQKSDTIWYNNKWEKTKEVNARHYYRVIEKLNSELYRISDYYETGARQMQGFFSSIDPDIKNGEFQYWYRSGKKQMHTTFEGNKQVQVCQYNEQGNVINEWELVPVVVEANGKLIIEDRVLPRSPKFPGGKKAMADFISNHIKNSVDRLGVRGEVYCPV